MSRLSRAAWLCALVCVSAAAQAREHEPVTVRVVPVQISAHAYYVQGQGGVASTTNEGYNSNAGFVITPDGVIAIDALGTPALGNELIRAIRSVTPLPIRRVIVTHYHADHIYGLQAFKEIGAEVWAHHDAREYLGRDAAARLDERRRDLSPWVNAQTRVVPPDRWLDERETLTLGGVRFEVIHMGPAHAPDDVVIIVPDDGVVFAGDILSGGRIPFVGAADSKRWLATIDRLLALTPRVLVAGHGKVSTDPARDLALTREYLIYLRTTMGRAVEDFVPFDDAYRTTDWSRFERIPAFEAANRINAYGTYLLMEKEALEKGR